jgi:hypothetical protein
MNCTAPEINEKLVSYAENLLSKSQQEEVKRHLAECQVCQKELQELQEILSKLKRYQTTLACPSIEELADYALNPSPILATHVEKCPACQEALEYLKEYENETPTFKVPAMSAKLRREFKAAYPKSGFNFSFPLLPPLFRQPILRFATLLILLCIGLWFFVAEYTKAPPPEISGQQSAVRDQRSVVSSLKSEAKEDKELAYQEAKKLETPLKLTVSAPTSAPQPKPTQILKTKALAVTAKGMEALKTKKPALLPGPEVTGGGTNVALDSKAVKYKSNPSLIRIYREPSPLQPASKASPAQEALTPEESQTLAPTLGTAKTVQSPVLSENLNQAQQAEAITQLKDFYNPSRDMQTALSRILNKEVQVEYSHSATQKTLKVYTALSLSRAEKESCRSLLRQKFSFSAKDSIIFLTP